MCNVGLQLYCTAFDLLLLKTFKNGFQNNEVYASLKVEIGDWEKMDKLRWYIHKMHQEYHYDFGSDYILEKN